MSTIYFDDPVTLKVHILDTDGVLGVEVDGTPVSYTVATLEGTQYVLFDSPLDVTRHVSVTLAQPAPTIEQVVDNGAVEFGGTAYVTATVTIEEGTVQTVTLRVASPEATDYPMSLVTGMTDTYAASFVPGQLVNHTYRVLASNGEGGTNQSDLRTLVIQDTTAPAWRGQTQTHDTILVSTTNTLTAEALDIGGLEWAILATNESGTWQEFTWPVTDWWDHDWAHRRAVTVTEAGGGTRTAETIDLFISEDQFPGLADCAAELRVADESRNEIPVQVYGETMDGGVLTCHLLFQASVDANASRLYYVYYGNPSAIVPSYTADLVSSTAGGLVTVQNSFLDLDLDIDSGIVSRMRLPAGSDTDLPFSPESDYYWGWHQVCSSDHGNITGKDQLCAGGSAPASGIAMVNTLDGPIVKEFAFTNVQGIAIYTMTFRFHANAPYYRYELVRTGTSANVMNNFWYSNGSFDRLGDGSGGTPVTVYNTYSYASDQVRIASFASIDHDSIDGANNDGTDLGGTDYRIPTASGLELYVTIGSTQAETEEVLGQLAAPVTVELGAIEDAPEGQYGSPMALNGATAWTQTSFAWQNSSIPDDTVVQWRIEYCDLSDNCGVTDIESFTIGEPPPEWLDSAWAYRRPVTISNQIGEGLTDYQVRVLLDNSFNFVGAQADGSDLRVTDSDGTTHIPFWIEIWDSGSQTATVWVKVPSIPLAGTTIYLYYGNAQATTASDGASTFIFFDDFEHFNLEGMNAPSYLSTPTYEGSGQVVHPDVVYVPGGWNGYEYWMGMTPYPDGNDAYENPSVIVSHDGITWIEPPGISNPLADAPAGGIANADSDILLVNDILIYYYNEANHDGINYVKRMTSTNGVDWSSPQTVITAPHYLMSPTFLYEDGTYYVWYMRSPGCTASYSDMYMRTSSDGITWGSEQSANISYPGHVVWHLDVQKEGDTYIMLVPSYPDTSTCADTSLYYAESTDRINWVLNTTPMLTPSSSGWDNAEIYRASFLVSGTYFRIWYSARSTGNQWHVGYTEGELDQFIGQQQPLWDEINGNVSATTDHSRGPTYGLREIGGSTYPQVLKDMNGRFGYSAWLYDDMSTASDFLAILRVYDQSDFIGVGIWVGQSTTNYAYHNAGAGWHYFTTGIPRTAGWHRLSINIGHNPSHLYVDDSLVASLGDLDEDNISRISLEGYRGGTGWFDDAYVRQYREPEPSSSLGPEEGSPTAVTLASFAAEPGAGRITLAWETGFEVDILGFNLYRSLALSGAYVRLNDALIRSQAPGSPLGAVYTWVDRDVEPGITYYYKLEDLDVHGVSTLHGPVWAAAEAPLRYSIYLPMVLRD